MIGNSAKPFQTPSFKFNDALKVAEFASNPNT